MLLAIVALLSMLSLDDASPDQLTEDESLRFYIDNQESIREHMLSVQSLDDEADISAVVKSYIEAQPVTTGGPLMDRIRRRRGGEQQEPIVEDEKKSIERLFRRDRDEIKEKRSVRKDERKEERKQKRQARRGRVKRFLIIAGIVLVLVLVVMAKLKK